MAFAPSSNSATAFKPREGGPAEFAGQADIDGERYNVTVEPSENRQSDKGTYVSRKIRFEGTDNGLVFEGRVFDKRIDSATGQERQLKEKQPQWDGKVQAKVNHELTVSKKIAVWEKSSERAGGYLFMSIREDVPYVPPQQAVEATDNPF